MSSQTPYCYTGLKPGEQAIRLVRLHPGQFSDDVFVSIFHIDLDEAEYEALSYTWGPPPQHTCNLSIGQGTSAPQLLEIRPLLLETLRYLRHCDTPRVLWIDAICINQQSLPERSQQVPRMGDIYNRARQVLVWLGPDHNSGTHLALETIKHLSAGVTLLWHRRTIAVLPGSEADVVKRHPEKSTLSLAHWAALRGFLTRPWFQRLWVRQEVVLASKVVVRCGPFEAEWGDVEKVVLLLENADVKGLIGMDAMDLRICRSLFPYYGSDEISHVLHRSSLCGYSVCHDLVYANLALSPAINALHIEPDYALPFPVVSKDLVCKYLARWGNMGILRSCDPQTALEGVGSFVPNFSVPHSESHLMDKFYASGGTKQLPFDMAGDGATLRLKGRYVATIDYVSEVRKPLAGDFTQRDKNMEVLKSFHRWEPEDLFSPDYPTGGTLLDAFVMLLGGGVHSDVYVSTSNATIQECREAFLAAAWSGGDLNLVDDRKYWRYLKELIQSRRGEEFFRCTEGHIGLSPAGVRRGDVVVVLAGGDEPYVLRPTQTGGSVAYQVVGPCFLQGVMFGEGLLGSLPEPWSCQLNGNLNTLQFCFRNRESGGVTLEDPRLWPLPRPWQIHFCDMPAGDNTCPGGVQECSEEPYQGGRLKNRHFLNTKTLERTEYDPRLNVVGLENGGVVELETFLVC